MRVDGRLKIRTCSNCARVIRGPSYFRHIKRCCEGCKLMKSHVCRGGVLVLISERVVR